MKYKPVFFTSDWHIGHEKVISYSNRPFNNVDHMSETLIKRYNSTVPKNGVCYFLGDMGFCSKEILHKVISSLNGTKVLVLGNHDKKTQGMYNLGFDVVMYGATLLIANKRVTLSHCPLLGVYREVVDKDKGVNWHGDIKESRKIFTCSDEGQYHLHGHIHSPNSNKSEKIAGKQYDVGVDANKFTPVSESQIESWIMLTEKERYI